MNAIPPQAGASWLGCVIMLAVVGMFLMLLLNPRTRASMAILLVLGVLAVLFIGTVRVARFGPPQQAVVVQDVVQAPSPGQWPTSPSMGARNRRTLPPAKPPPPPEGTEVGSVPAWVEAPDGPVGDVQELSVRCGPYETREACEAELPHEIARRLEELADEGRLGPTGHWRPTAAEISPMVDRLVVDRYWQARTTSVGEMQILHARVVLGPSLKTWIAAQVRAHEVTRRIQLAGLGMAMVFAGLGSVWGSLRLTQQVRGRHPKPAVEKAVAGSDA